MADQGRPKGDGAPGARSERPDGAEHEITAPSLGPETVIENEAPEDRLARDGQSDTDAMGLDKHREVIGRAYGPSLGRQATVYGLFILVVVAIGVGAKLLVDELDRPPAKVKAQAPWAREGVQQHKPAPLQ